MNEITFISVYVVIGLIIFISLIYLYRVLSTPPISKPKFTQEELDFLENKMPTMENFEPVRFKQIKTDIRLDDNEYAIAKFDLESIQFMQKMRSFGGHTATANFVPGFNFGMNRRTIEEEYKRVTQKSNKILETTKRVIADSENNLYKVTLPSVELVRFAGERKLRISTTTKTAGIIVKFKKEKDLIKFVNIYLTYRMADKLDPIDNDEVIDNG